jgi:uncharacterized membrane protein
MRKYLKTLGLLLLFFGVAGIIYTITTGDARIYILVIVPIIAVRGLIGVLSVLSLIAGFLIWVVSTFGKYTGFERDTDRSGNRRIRSDKEVGSSWGGVIFLGPFPIIFGSSEWREKIPSWIYILVLAILALIIAQIILFFSLLSP